MDEGPAEPPEGERLPPPGPPPPPPPPIPVPPPPAGPPASSPPASSLPASSPPVSPPATRTPAPASSPPPVADCSGIPTTSAQGPASAGAQVFVMAADGTQVARLTFDQGDDGTPA